MRRCSRPVVSPTVAGAALTGFSGGLMGLYWNTPGLRKPGTPWPTPDGLGVSKDVWMLGIGVGLLLDGLTRGAKKTAKSAPRRPCRPASSPRPAQPRSGRGRFSTSSTGSRSAGS